VAPALLPEIDRLILNPHASEIGSGIPMFNGRSQPQVFRPADMRQLDSGVVLTLARL
jgi:hypothetical protein